LVAVLGWGGAPQGKVVAVRVGFHGIGSCFTQTTFNAVADDGISHGF